MADHIFDSPRLGSFSVVCFRWKNCACEKMLRKNRHLMPTFIGILSTLYIVHTNSDNQKTME